MIEKVSTFKEFRNSFKLVNKERFNWFPGHMNKGLKQMQQKLRNVDCIIEVHDARIPLSGRNKDFKNFSGIKPHILVLNKVDLVQMSLMSQTIAHLKHEHEHILCTNSKNLKCDGIKRLFPLTYDLLSSSPRYNRINEEDYQIMFIGVPNVGKSSLVNTLRIKHLGKGKAAPVGAKPGVTRSVMNRIKMCETPSIYMVDTPGILTPTVEDIESGLKLGLCGIIEDHIIGEQILADYLLFWLNRQQHFDYVHLLGLRDPTDNILDALVQLSKVHDKKIRVRNQLNDYVIRPDLHSAAKLFLKMFRDGKLGKLMLDENLIFT